MASARAPGAPVLPATGTPAGRPPGQEPPDVVDVYPLAPMQEAMLLHGRGGRGAGLYVQQFVCTLDEPLGFPELRLAWERLVDRHAVLRTSFHLDASPEPLQRVHARVELPWAEHDWRSLPPGAQEERMERFLREDRLAGFDPAAAPLVRLTLFRLGDEACRLVWTSHHALLDGHARRLLVREVFEEYEALLEGRECSPPEPLSYREYVGWLRQAEPSASRAFWEEALRGFEPPNGLALEPGGAGREGRERHRFRLSAELTGALRELARREGVTLGAVLQGAWALLLCRYTGAHDVAFGATRACRHGAPAEAARVVGLLSNTVPVRVRIDEERTVAAHLAEVRALWLAMRPYERTHMARIQEWSGVPAGTPLCETLFGFETESAQETLRRLGGRWERRAFDLLQWISYPLSAIAHGGAAVAFQVVYDPSRFGAEAVRRLGDHLARVLAAFAEDPGRRLDQVGLLGSAERHHLLAELNPPARPYPGPACIPALFGAQAARTPDAAAVVFEGEALTYGELDRRSTQLAHALRRRGVGPEVRVGVCMERSPELVVALLAVLKAGGAYVPLDPDYPPDRLGFVLEDSGVALVLCQERSAGALPAGGPARMVAAPLWAQAEGESTRPVGPAPEPEALAYVIYTSGSTGRPKGAMNAHRGVVNRLLWMQEEYGLDASDAVLQKTPYSFDVSVWEFFWPLVAGARLVLARPGGHRDPAYLREVMRAEGITTLHFVPSMLGAFLEAGGADAPALRRVVCSGEALPHEMQERFFARFPGVELHNLYGPTEAAVDVTYWACRPGDPRRTVPIGRPVANTRTYVLDARLEPVPSGVAGELYLGGVQVGRGYLARPGLTAERFLPDPFAGPGARMYRTGDRARWLPDGALEYLGRTDQQVKVRGFRIEPGEIEAALREHPGVGDAVVVAREASGGTRLVAYLVCPAGAVPSAELRGRLASRLPEHMVPSAFVALDAFPLTPSGKLDRRSLPDPEAAAAEDGYAAPRTPAEEVLAGLFAGVLGVERVGARDDFFALGGHSLLATRLAARVRDALGVELPLHAVLDARTVRELARVVEASGADGTGAPEAPPVRPVPRDRPLPLSFAQERLWFLDRLHPGGAAYNVAALFRLEGALDGAALQRGLDAVAARHEALRTVFYEEGGEPRQRIHPPAPFPLLEVECGTLPGGAAEALLLAEEEARRPFHLDRGPLARGLLLRLHPECHLLLLSLHHVVADGESIGVLADELRACYGAYAAGREPVLPGLPVQYADYAAWQREHLTDRRLAPSLEYWGERLAGAEPPMLPADRARPEAPRFPGRRLRVSLPEALASRVRDGGREAHATSFMVLLAAFKALLARYSGRADVVVVSPFAGREPAEVERLIGFFVNTLALRTPAVPDEGFRALLGRVRATTLGAYEHRHAPFDRVVAELHARGEAGAQLARVMFAYRNAEGEALALPGLAVSRVPVERGAAKFDLMLSLQETAAGVEGAWEYDAELFDASTVERMDGHFRRLLEGALAAPHAPLAELAFLPEAERREVLAAAAGPVLPVPATLPVHRLFAAQAALTPEAPAVVFRDRALSFAELDRRSDRLAHALRERGVGPEVRVALLFQRGVEAVVAVLGVLKAGGAYVPLDPAHPAERLAAVLEECGAPLVLAGPGTDGRLPEGAAPVLRLDAGPPPVAREGGGPPACGVLPENAAYVIYTSGSTGRPRGVVVQHRSVLNLAEALRHAVYGRRAAAGPARVTVNGPLTFDTSVKQLVQLLHGATLYVVPEEVRYDGRALAAFLRANRVEVLDCTPAQLRLLLADGLLEAAGPALTDVLVAGEAVDEATWRSLAAGRVAFHNLYGPTECTVDATACAVPDFPDAPVIGRPLANVRAYVLDDRLAPVPHGVPGELYVAGAGVTRGYLGRPGLTAERFLPDPFAPGGGERMYRTGDRARQRADGALEFLGRVDDQVKIRGFRVEPGEVEAVLAQHPGIAAAAVVAREDVPGERRLVAYVAGRGGRTPPASELRERLARRLPAYMVPSDFVALDALPVTRHGKVDRRALPAPELLSTERYVAPRTATEEVLAGIWAEVLGLERVGAEDDFFHLGGHSLRVARVASRVREELGVELPLAAVFETPTVEGVARRVEDARRAGGGAGAAPLRRAPRGGPLPLSFAQRRLWLVHQLDPASPAYNLPLVLRLRGALDGAALRHALDGVVRRHEVLRTRLVGSGAEAEQRVDAPAPVPLPAVDLRALPDRAREEAARGLLAEEAARPFDLAAGPVLRARLLRVGGAEHLLSLTLHHAAGDGWSTEVLLRELGALYGAFAGGEPARLPELPVQYADFAAWQHRRLEAGELEPLLAYWRGRLAGAPPLLDLPVDRPRTAVPGARAATRSAVLPPEQVRSLRALSRREGCTLFVTLLAGFQALLGRWAGEEDVVVGIPVANRGRAELEPLVGFFVDTLPLRTDLAGDPTVAGLLGRVRRSVLEAQAHAELPLERLAEEPLPAGSPRHAPLFQVLFALQGAAEAPRLPGLDAERVEVATGAAKYDLTLVVEERGEALSAALTFRAGLWDDATAGRMLEHLARLLDGMAAGPERRVWEIGLAGEEEARLLAGGGAARAAGSGEDVPVHELVARRAAEAPDRTAVVCAERTLTYGELDRLAGRLAGLLRRRGAGPDVPVALVLERSPELVVAMLAVLRAGAAYLPIDPSTPRERIAAILADAAAPLVLTQAALRDRLPADARGVLCLDGALADAAGEPREAPRAAAAPESLAYVVFTSGSTGRPKGVMVPHRGLANLVRWHLRAFGVTARDRATQLAGLGFDASVWETWPYLAAGATLHLVADEETRGSPAALRSLLLERGITVAFVPTPLAEGMLALGWPERAPLRVLLTGGDRLRVRPPAGLPFTLVNAYGPTECSVVATSGPVPPAEPGGRAPDVGGAIDGARAYVLDGRTQPVPAGVPGELYVGGAGVARGYLGRPGATAAAFLPDPFAGEPGARMYRTGDRVRRLPGGELEFLGRMDRQVKVRGFRVEPAEVEVLLRGHPQLRDAAVVAREDAPGAAGPRLVAYLVPAADARPSAAELRAGLREHLPEYMLPSAFVWLGALPLTPSGKTDRRALPAPDPGAAAGGEHVAPRTPAEELLAGIWAEVLGTERVGVRDDFFELGGHSLLAVQAVARIRRATGVRVPLHAFVAGATVEAVARLAAREARPALPPPLVPLRGGGGRRPFFCVHAVDGHVLSYTALAGLLAPERPVYGVQAAGVDGGDPLDSVEEMAAGYVEALRSVQPAGPYALGGWSMGGVVAFEMARQLHAAGEAADVLVLVDPPRAVRAGPAGDEAGLPAEVARVRRAHLRALRAYRPVGVPVRALLLEAAERAAPSAPAERRFEWDSLCGGGVERVRVPGDHYALLREPAVRRVAREVDARLSHADRS